jgi:hypothetical protein
MKPHQIISLTSFEGTDNRFAMGDHDDHIHVGFRPMYGKNSTAARRVAAVREQPSRLWVAVTTRASKAPRE